MMRKTLTVLLVMTLVTTTALQAQTLKPFQAGDRVAFVGNSITDGGHYHS